MGLIGTMIQTHIGGKMSKNEIKKIQNKRLKKFILILSKKLIQYVKY